MKYNFDSDTLYQGDDGYVHLRPFGVGQYSYTKNYIQKLPLHYQVYLEYNILKDFTIGVNNNGNKDINMYKYYMIKQHNQIDYKVGYINKANIITLGISNKKYTFDISNKFGSNNNILLFAYKIKFDFF
jgi:hypothetical protein